MYSYFLFTFVVSFVDSAVFLAALGIFDLMNGRGRATWPSEFPFFGGQGTRFGFAVGGCGTASFAGRTFPFFGGQGAKLDCNRALTSSSSPTSSFGMVTFPVFFFLVNKLGSFKRFRGTCLEIKQSAFI